MTLGLCGGFVSRGHLTESHRKAPTASMSRRRKHVRNLVDEALPELTQGDEVCVVTELRGGNQVEVRACD